MIIKTVSNEEEFFAMCAMPASSREQNQALLEMYRDHSISFASCWIMLDQERIVARSFADAHLTFLTMEAIVEADAARFIKRVLKEIKEDLVVHLYSDKCHHDLIKKGLLLSEFDITQEKESYIAQPQSFPSTLTFKDGSQVQDTTFMQLIEASYQKNCDRSFMADANRLGAQKAAASFYQEIIQEEPFHHRQVLLADGACAGVLFLNAMPLGDMGIGYLAVHPQYRGHGYGTELLKKACSIAYADQATQLIADIDVQNTYIRHVVESCGFQFSCQELVFEKTQAS